MSDQKMSDQKMSERMAALKTEAEARVKVLLWDGADADEIAGAALRGGIDPARVDRLANDVAEARRVLATAEAAHKRLPELTAAHDTATATAATAAAELERAQRADDAAREALGDAEAAVRVAGVEREAGARLLADGIIPPDAAPPFMAEIVSGWEEQEAARKHASRIQSLKRREIPWRENRVAALAKELKDQKAQDPKKENQTIGGGGFVNMQTALAARLKTERAELKSARDELKKLEQAAA
jgi:hypothetical protein